MNVRRTAATLAAALLLSACTTNADPPDDKPTPSGSTSANSSPSPSTSTSAAPTMPVEAKGASQKAAEAFTKYYFALITHAMVTGDTAPLRENSTDTCKSCANVAKIIDDAYAKGAWFETKGWEITFLHEGRQLTDGFEFLLKVREHPRTLKDAGKAVDQQPAADYAMRAVIQPVEGQWRMTWLDTVR